MPNHRLENKPMVYELELRSTKDNQVVIDDS